MLLALAALLGPGMTGQTRMSYSDAARPGRAHRRLETATAGWERLGERLDQAVEAGLGLKPELAVHCQHRRVLRIVVRAHAHRTPLPPAADGEHLQRLRDSPA